MDVNANRDRAERAKAAVSIERVIAQDIELRQKGREFVGLCPFHQDTDPSLNVVPAKGLYKCFACDASGDAIDWLRKHRGLSWTDAVGALETMAGLPALNAAAAGPRKRGGEDDFGDRRRKESINHARTMWTAAGRIDGAENHPRARAYFEARGVLMDFLPEAGVPRSIRFYADTPREWKEPGMPDLPKALPALLCAYIGNQDDKVWAVQRLYLDVNGGPGKLVGVEKPKRARGSMRLQDGGGAVRLCPLHVTSGWLLITEGVETGVAVLAATHTAGGAVWAALSAMGMRALTLPAYALNGTAGVGGHVGAPITRITVCGDTDKSKTGLKAAVHLAERLSRAHPAVRVEVALPDQAVAPMLFGPDGKIKDGKSVDWDDVQRTLGPDATLAAINTTARVIRFAGVEGEGQLQASVAMVDEPEEGGERPILDKDSRKRAKWILGQRFAPWGKGQAWRLARYNGQWWSYRWFVHHKTKRAMRRWMLLPEETLKAMIAELVEQCDVLNAEGEAKPAAIGANGVRDILAGLVSLVLVDDDKMPCWLPPACDDQGEVKWQTFRTSAVHRPRAEQRKMIAYENGLLDFEEVKRGRVVLHPSSSSWFTAVAMPFSLDVEMLKRAIEGDAGFEQEFWRPIAPKMMSVLDHCFDECSSSFAELQKFAGYGFEDHNRYGKMAWIPGAPGTGKGSLVEIFVLVAGGDEHVATPDIEDLGTKYGNAGLIGKMFAVITEVRTDRNTPVAKLLNNLFRITTDNAVQVEQKFVAAEQGVRMPVKFIFTPNDPPPIRDASVGMGRRLLFLPVTGKSFAEGTPGGKQANVNLSVELVAEAPIIQAWALCGALRLEREGKFNQTSLGLAAIEEMKEQQAPVYAFIKEHLDLGVDFEEPVEDVWLKWEAWCKEEKRDHVGTKAQLGQALHSLVPTVNRAHKQEAWARVPIYRGLKLRVAGSTTPQLATQATSAQDASEEVVPF